MCSTPWNWEECTSKSRGLEKALFSKENLTHMSFYSLLTEFFQKNIWLKNHICFCTDCVPFEFWNKYEKIIQFTQRYDWYWYPLFYAIFEKKIMNLQNVLKERNSDTRCLDFCWIFQFLPKPYQFHELLEEDRQKQKECLMCSIGTPKIENSVLKPDHPVEIVVVV